MVSNGLFLFSSLLLCVNVKSGILQLNPSKENQNENLCTFHEENFYTNCSMKNLTYIPKVNPKTKVLNMSGNSLPLVDETVLSNISEIYIENLDISKNNLQVIVNGSFLMLSYLKILNVSNNPIRKRTILNLTSGIPASLESLFLEKVEFSKIPYKYLAGLKRTNLQHLSFRYNNLTYVTLKLLFEIVPNLKSLDLANNVIHEMNTVCRTQTDGACSRQLQSLDLSANDFTNFQTFCREASVFPNLKFLTLDHNCIKDLKMERIDCLDHLESLHMHSVRIEEVPFEAFTPLTSLKDLQLTGTMSIWSVRPFAFKSKSIETLNISRNHAHLPLNTSIFFNNTALRVLDISQNFLRYLEESDWETMFQNAPNIVNLHLRRVDLYYAPKAIPNYLPNLEELYLSDNKLEFFPSNYFLPLKHLKNLSLQGNQITVVQKEYFPELFIKHLEFLDLSFNPYACDCDVVWFLGFSYRHRDILKHYSDPFYYHCSDGIPMMYFAGNLSKSCILKKETAQILKFSCSSSMLLFIVSSVIYRYRWRLRYLLYVLRFHRRKYASSTNSSQFKHDIYISCSDSDFNVVFYQIVSILEEKGLNVYFPYRDATPGSLIVRESLEHLDRSKSIILCLSDAIAQDNWCEFEACMAIERSVCATYDNKVMIVVVLEEMNITNVTKIINQLTRNGDYLKWDKNMDTNVLFWRKLDQFLK